MTLRFERPRESQRGKAWRNPVKNDHVISEDFCTGHHGEGEVEDCRARILQVLF